MSGVSQALKPCPFCGGGDVDVSSESCGWRVDCAGEDCFSRGPWPYDCTSAQAIAAWNTRATEAQQAERIAQLEADRDALVKRLEAIMPTGLCLTNRNIPDGFTVPLEMDTTMGELREIAATLARIKGDKP